MKIDHLTQNIVSRRSTLPGHIASLAAISGIDGSGKSSLAKQLAQHLNENGANTIVIGLDAWHNPPEKRFNKDDPAGHFYRHAFRFDELFDVVINPLRLNRALQVTVELTRLP